MNASQSPDALTDLWIDHLREMHGQMISGPALRHLLGFNDSDAFGRAVQTGRSPVRTFKLRGRQAHFAWTDEVATWLASLGAPLPRQRR